MGVYRGSVVRVMVVVFAAAALVFAASRWTAEIEIGDAAAGVDPASATSSAGASAPVNTPVDQGALVCPGPERVGLADSALDEGDQAVTLEARASPEQALPLAVSDLSGSIQLQATDGGTLASIDRRTDQAAAVITEAQGVVVAASGSLAPAVSASQVYLGDQDGRLGLALTPCTAPQDESWLIAGGGQAGHAERLVMVNPGQGAITATVTVFGLALEARDGQSSTEIALEPGAREIVLLDALAPGEAAPVVRVESNGGPISAFLGDQLLDGTTDQGTELTPPVAAPAAEQVIVGFDVPEGSADSATVRVAVPGPEQAVIEIRALTGAGSVPIAQDVTLVPGGRSAEILLSDLPEGTYALAMSSDEDFVAAAEVRSAPDVQGRQDVAWGPGAAPLGSVAGTPLPQLAQGPRVGYSVDLFAPSGGTVRLILMDDQGATEESTLDLFPGAVLTRDLGSATAVWLLPESTSGPTYAAIRGEVEAVSRPADDALTLDESTSTQAPEDGDGGDSDDGDSDDTDRDDGGDAADSEDDRSGQDEVRLISVLPLRELSVFRSVTALTPALP
ncbi:MAG: DUF5719 family protein [Ornithinimicrobium sp.]